MVLCACLLFLIPGHQSLNDLDLQLSCYYITEILPVLDKTKLTTTIEMATFLQVLFSPYGRAILISWHFFPLTIIKEISYSKWSQSITVRSTWCQDLDPAKYKVVFLNQGGPSFWFMAHIHACYSQPCCWHIARFIKGIILTHMLEK